MIFSQASRVAGATSCIETTSGCAHLQRRQARESGSRSGGHAGLSSAACKQAQSIATISRCPSARFRRIHPRRPAEPTAAKSAAAPCLSASDLFSLRRARLAYERFLRHEIDRAPIAFVGRRIGISRARDFRDPDDRLVASRCDKKTPSSPFCIARRLFRAMKLRTPVQLVLSSRTRSSHE